MRVRQLSIAYLTALPVLFEKTKIQKNLWNQKKNVSLKPFLGSGTHRITGRAAFSKWGTLGTEVNPLRVAQSVNISPGWLYNYPAWQKNGNIFWKMENWVLLHQLSFEQNRIVTRQMWALSKIVLEQETDLLLKKKRMGEIQNIQNGSCGKEVLPFS